MSQNPGGPNYNPYGPTPSNPNYPPNTGYGGQQPPSGPQAGYPPYQNPPSGPQSGYPPYQNPPSGPDSNVPNSGYSGPYASNPYAPPPPTNPYNTPPPPPTTGTNTYDPYAQTAMSQNPISSPGYTAYGAGATPLGPNNVPPPTQPKRGRGLMIAILLIALVLIVGGSIFGVVTYSNNQATQHANGTSTAVAQANNSLTATAQVYATGTAIATTYPFSNKLVLNDPMVDNSKGVKWDSTSSCYFSGSAYHTVESDSRYYNVCAALGSDYANFTFESQMVIKTGGTAGAGGLIFRADADNNKYYRLSIDTTGSYFFLVIVDNTGTNGNARILKEGTASSFETGLNQVNTLAVVARGDEYSFYVNKQLVTTFTDSTYTHGQIGFDADYGDSKTDLVFTNTKVWELPK